MTDHCALASFKSHTNPALLKTHTLCRIRSLHSSTANYGIADKFKDAIYSLTPKELLDESRLPQATQLQDSIPNYNTLLERQNAETHSAINNSIYRRSTDVRAPQITQGITGSHVHLPLFMIKTIENISSPPEKLFSLIKNYPTISPQAILLLAKPIKESFSEDQLVELALYLYLHFYPREACNLLASTLPLSSAIFVFSSKFIPKVVSKTSDIQLDRPDFLLLNITSALLATRRHSLILQLLQEIQHSTDIFDGYDMNAQSLIQEARLSNLIFTATNTKELESIFNHTKIEAFFKDEASDGIKLSILKSVSILKDTSLLTRLINSDLAFFSSKYVLYNIISEIHHQYQLTSDKSAIEETLLPVLLDALDHHKNPGVSFHPVDLALLPYLAITKTTLNKLWRRARELLNKVDILRQPNQTPSDSQEPTPNNNNVFYTIEAYKLFLEKSIALRQTYTCVEILKDSRRSIKDPEIIASALNTVVWGRQKVVGHRRPEKTVENQNKILSYQKLDTKLLQQAFSYPPKPELQDAIYTLLYRLNIQYKTTDPQNAPAHPIPRSILWSIIKALDLSPKIEYLDTRIEQQLALLIATRPISEQFEYYSIKVISIEGVLHAVLAHINRLRMATQETESPTDEVNIQLVLSALIMMRSKTSHDLNPQLLSQIITNLCEMSSRKKRRPLVSTAENVSSPDSPADSAHDQLKQQKMHMLQVMEYVRPSEKTSMSIVKSLLRKSQYSAALQYIEIAKNNIPTEAVYLVMAHASYGRPLISMQLLNWLKADRDIMPPPQVLRKMAIGFSKSPVLTDSQSRVRVEKIMRLLRIQQKSLGSRAATGFVDSLISRALSKGQGSRQRLDWAMAIARRQRVDPEQIRHWMEQLDYMRMKRVGYWASDLSHSSGHHITRSKTTQRRTLSLLRNFIKSRNR